MGYKSLLSIIIITTSLIGCSFHQNMLKEDELKCSTFIEGKFIAPKSYNSVAPIVLLKNGNDKKYFRGTVINRNEQGIFLQEHSYSFLDDQDTLFIEYEKIRAIVDESKFCVYGELEDKECEESALKFYLEKENDPKYQPIFLELKSNQNFKYCAKPGRYKLVKIIKEISSDYYYESFPFFEFKVDVVENKVNYIGNIELVKTLEANDRITSIPYFKQVKTQNAGAAFGLIGGVIAGLTNDSWEDEVRGYFNFLIQAPVDQKKYNSEQFNITPIEFYSIK